MGEICDLWAAAAPSRRQPTTIASSEEFRSATDARSTPKSAEASLSIGGAGSRPALASNALVFYTGAFRNRQSRFETRSLRRYGDYLYDVPLVLLWNDVDYNWGSGSGDLWDC